MNVIYRTRSAFEMLCFHWDDSDVHKEESNLDQREARNPGRDRIIYIYIVV